MIFSRNTKHEKRINGRKIFANVSGGVVCDFVLFCFFGVASGRHVLAPSVYQQDGSNDGIPLLGQGMIHLRCFRRLRICPKCVIRGTCVSPTDSSSVAILAMSINLIVPTLFTYLYFFVRNLTHCFARCFRCLRICPKCVIRGNKM
uniref:Uncharacterized protein n=1 Tax=Cacopsylla melanoneura TaxID=428564 RepID=A0A8D9E7T0_9HEMI